MNKTVKTWHGETTIEGLPIVTVDANNMSYGRIVTSRVKATGLELGDTVLLYDSVEDQWEAKLTQLTDSRAYFTLIEDLDTGNCCRNCGAKQQ